MSRINAGKLSLAVLLAWSMNAGPARAQEEFVAPQPTSEHELLKRGVGTWDAKMSIFPPGGAEPMVSDAVETNVMLGNYWIVSRFEGKMGDQPFSGVGTFGYDPTEKKFVGNWVDSMSPYAMTEKGDYDPATETMTTIGEGRDLMTGKTIKTKNVSRYLDDNTRSFEMHIDDGDGQFTKMMEINYTRQKP